MLTGHPLVHPLDMCEEGLPWVGLRGTRLRSGIVSAHAGGGVTPREWLENYWSKLLWDHR